MSLNLGAEIRIDGARTKRNETESLDERAVELIMKVIEDVRIVGSSPHIEDALGVIESLNSIQKTSLLGRFGGSLRGAKRFPDVVKILNALTVKTAIE